MVAMAMRLLASFSTMVAYSELLLILNVRADTHLNYPTHIVA